MKITERLSGGEWLQIPRYYSVWLTKPDDLPRAAAANTHIRTAALQTQNVDKGFERFVRRFETAQPVAATIWVEEWLPAENGWAVFMQQRTIAVSFQAE
jgi:hypothetical protein